jgi:CDP-glucose 4,6-dehydratase
MKDASFDIYRGRRILLTGDTGFKGSWLSLWLTCLGAEVRGFSLGPRTEYDNYVICGLGDLITHVAGDVRDYAHLLRTFADYHPEMVFHLAAQSIVLESYIDPENTFSTNMMGTVNVLEAVRKTASVRAAIIVTSDKCYENKGDGCTFREEDRLGGSDPYSASKGAAEIITSSYIRSFFSESGTAAIASVRAGNAIGGGDWSPSRLVPDCIRALQANNPIQIRNPEAVRPWQYVLEPLYGYLLLGARLFTKGKDYSGAWNFGPFPTGAASVLHVVQGVIDAWGGGTYVINEAPLQNGEAPLLQLDISKALVRLKWKPILSLGEAIQRAISEYRIVGLSTLQVREQRIAHIKDYTVKTRDRR